MKAEYLFKDAEDFDKYFEKRLFADMKKYGQDEILDWDKIEAFGKRNGGNRSSVSKLIMLELKLMLDYMTW